MPADAAFYLAHGAAFPFDGSASFWTHGEKPEPAKDWAHAAARGIIANLADRRGIKQELDTHNIEAEMRVEIIEDLAAIIREAAKTAAAPAS